jgi:hypothetical protein
VANFTWFTGVVEDINDPKFMNRVRVRCFDYHTHDKSIVKTEDLPWATVMMPTSSASTSGLGVTPHGLVQGSWVVGFFRDGSAAQDAIVMGSIASMSTAGPDGAVGFNDPDEVYPTEQYIDNPDVNEHARLETTELVDQKKQSIDTDVPTATGGSWSEPETPFAPIYPNNKVHQTTSGHVFEVDDTPEAERIHEYHRTGTFREVHPDGTIVTRIVGDDYTIVQQDNNVHVLGNVNLTIDSNCTTYVKGDWDIKVDGDLDIDVKGNITQDAALIYLNRDNGDAWAAARLGDTADTGDAGTGSHFDTNSAGTDKIETGSGTVFIGK